MVEKSDIGSIIARSETIRKARELAWSMVALFATIPILFFVVIFFWPSASRPFVYDEHALKQGVISVASLALLFRMVPVAIQLGRDLKSRELLLTQAINSTPFTYLWKRYFGIDANAA